MRYLSCWGLVLFLLSGCATTSTQAPSVSDQSEQPKVDYSKAADINAQLALDYSNEGFLDRAKEKLLVAKQFKPDLPKVLVASGYYYQTLGNAGQAEKDYQQALKVAPDNYQALNYYASFLCTQPQQYQRALQMFTHSINLLTNDDLSQTFWRLGQCYETQKKWRQAQQAYIKSVKQNHGEAKVFFDLANVDYQLGEYVSAKQNIDSYIQRVGSTQKDLTLKMQILEKLGDNDAAASVRLQLSSQQFSA